MLAMVAIVLTRASARVAHIVPIVACAAVLAWIFWQARVTPAPTKQQRIIIHSRAIERTCNIVYTNRLTEASIHYGVRIEVGGAIHISVNEVVRKRGSVEIRVEITLQERGGVHQSNG